MTKLIDEADRIDDWLHLPETSRRDSREQHHKQTLEHVPIMSALPAKGDIRERD
jgi:hypothetical protein